MDTIAPAASDLAPATAAGLRFNPLVRWLLSVGWELPDPGELTRDLASAMIRVGIPLTRMRITLRLLHPLFLGTSYTWSKKTGAVEEYQPAHEILQDDAYLRSPYVAIFEGAGGVRRRLDTPDAVLDFPILEELVLDGATDYVAMPLTFADGKRHAITIAADRPGGFSAVELEIIYDALPILARLLELHATRRTARTILETYLGRQTGERVLNGLIRRGDGENIHAVIWFSDLRGSTRLADRMPRETFMALLDDYFEATASAVLDNGGEVLRFIGDATLAIFPIGAVTPHPDQCTRHIAACQAALTAAREAGARIDAKNRDREARGLPLIRFGIGLHLGDVVYGNIGAPQRLEFSVIGAAANEAARIEGMCKVLGYPILVSEAVARVVGADLVALGSHALRGVAEPQELYTLR